MIKGKQIVKITTTVSSNQEALAAPSGSLGAMLALLLGDSASVSVNTLTETSAGKVLDARQGKVLKDLIDTLTSTVSNKETSGVAAALVNALKAGSTETIASLKASLDTLSALVTGTTPDGDNIVNTIQELLATFAAYPEGLSLVASLTAKLDVTLYNSNRISDQADVALKAPLSIPVATKTASYTLVLADAGSLIRMNVASANTLTIPTNATVAFPIGTQITFSQTGAGQVTLVPTGGVTINSADSYLKTRVQFSTATLVKTLTDTWLLTGDLTA